MEIKGKIKDVYNQFRQACIDKKFDLEKKYNLYIVEEKEKTPEEIRRLEQNSKYWALLREFAKWGGISQTEMHNNIMKEYAPIVMEKKEDGKLHKKWVILPSDYPWQKEMYYHYLPSGKKTKDEQGKEYELFYVLKKSSKMTVNEFSELLNGLINEILGSEAPIDVNYEGV